MLAVMAGTNLMQSLGSEGRIWLDPFISHGRVVGVDSGDNITVLENGHVVRIRLSGIRCPELTQPHGIEARRFTTEMVLNREIEIVGEGPRPGRRAIILVRDVADNQSLNWKLVEAGLAWWDRKERPDDETLSRLENEARKAKRGLWSDTVQPRGEGN